MKLSRKLTTLFSTIAMILIMACSAYAIQIEPGTYGGPAQTFHYGPYNYEPVYSGIVVPPTLYITTLIDGESFNSVIQSRDFQNGALIYGETQDGYPLVITTPSRDIYLEGQTIWRKTVYFLNTPTMAVIKAATQPYFLIETKTAGPKHLGYVSGQDVEATQRSLNGSEGYLLSFSKGGLEGVLQYKNDAGIWVNSDAAITIDDDGNVIANDIVVTKETVNRKYRVLITKDLHTEMEEPEEEDVNIASSEFYVMANISDAPELNISGVDEGHALSFYVGDTATICPTLDNVTDDTSIVVSIKTNDASDYEELTTLTYDKNNASWCLLDIENLECAHSNSLIKLQYPDDTEEIYQLFVYETFSYDFIDAEHSPSGVAGYNITVHAGQSGIMNDYQALDAADKSFLEHGTILSNGESFDKNKVLGINFDNYIKTIPQKAFQNMSGLIHVTVPANVNSIKENAFKNCLNLREIKILNPDVTIAGKITDSRNDGKIAPTTENANLVKNHNSYPVLYSYGNKIKTYAEGNALAYCPLDITIDGHSYHADWNYVTHNHEIVSLILGTAAQNAIHANSVVDELHIPRTIDGYEVTTLNNESNPEFVICGKQEHTHTDECGFVCKYSIEEHTHITPDEVEDISESCYELICTNTDPEHEHCIEEECYAVICGKEEHAHDEACKQYLCGLEAHMHTDECFASYVGLDIVGKSPNVTHIHTLNGCYTLICDNTDESHIHTSACYELTCTQEATNGTIVKNLYIPATVGMIDNTIFSSLTGIEHIYNFAYTSQNIASTFSPAASAECWTYSPNASCRQQAPGFTQKIFDKSSMSGKLGQLDWAFNPGNGQLQISGTGASGDFDRLSDRSLDYISQEVTSLIIVDGVQSIGKNALAGFINLRTIDNRAQSLQHVDVTAFEQDGTHTPNANKVCKTYVNTELYNAVKYLFKITPQQLELQKQYDQLQIEYQNQLQNVEDTILGFIYAESILPKQNQKTGQYISSSNNISTVLSQIDQYRSKINSGQNSSSFPVPDTEDERNDLDAQLAELANDLNDTLPLIQEREDDLDALNEEIHNLPDYSSDDNTFKIVFKDTVGKCGPTMTWKYCAADQSLTFAGNGDMTAYTSVNQIPWLCANDTILTVNIGENIQSLSNYSLHQLVKLNTINNYAKYQYYNMTSFADANKTEYANYSSFNNVLDDIVREPYYGDDIFEIKIPNYTSTEKEQMFSDVARMLRAMKKDVTTEELKGYTKLCGLDEHTHTDDCVGPVLICYIDEHVHDASCYGSDGLLDCSQTVHTHDEDCYTTAYMCGLVDHTHTNACFKAPEKENVFIPGTYKIATQASVDEIIQIFTGERKDETKEEQIVTVYTTGIYNPLFNKFIRQNGTSQNKYLDGTDRKGYELKTLYKEGQAGVCGDNLIWYIDNNNILHIEGSGVMYDYSKGTLPWKDAAGSITKIAMSDAITHISGFAFDGFTKVTSITFPSSLISTGDAVCIDCENLETVSIPKNASLGGGFFAGCKQLNTLTIPQGGTCFEENGILYRKESGNAVTVLNYLKNSLYSNASTRTLYPHSVVAKIPNQTSNGYNVTAISNYAFYNNQTIEEIDIPANVHSIGSNAFELDNNLAKILNDATDQITADDAFGTINVPSGLRPSIAIYKANSQFGILGKPHGYSIKYYDDMKMESISAFYSGNGAMIEQQFNAAEVSVILYYDNGETEEINGLDSRITIPNKKIYKVGDNTFTLTYNDGYGQVIEGTQFTVRGFDSIESIEFGYNGLAVFYGEAVNPANVYATVKYKSGTQTETIRGDATYTKNGRQYNYLTLNPAGSLTTLGDKIKVNVTYLDANSYTTGGIIYVPVKNYITAIKASYPQDLTIKGAAGVAGISKSNLELTLTYADKTTKKVRGDDPDVEILEDYVTTGNYIIFTVTYGKDNRNRLNATFTTKADNDIKSISCSYIGKPVTTGMSAALSDIQVSLRYSDNSVQRITADELTGFTIDAPHENLVVNDTDHGITVSATYNLGDISLHSNSFNIPGKIREPLKLIINRRPNKSAYQPGDTFDRTGLDVTCLFDDNTIMDVNEYIVISNGDPILDEQKYVEISYKDDRSGTTVKTNLSVTVNKYQKEVTYEKEFKEQYEITRVLFRSKKTEDDTYRDSYDNGMTTDLTVYRAADEETGEEEYLGKWIDVTPKNGANALDEADFPEIKAGYGFEVKVFTRYRTNRAGAELTNFLRKSKWDDGYTEKYAALSTEINTKWKYLNDVYPQYTPTANPDILYLRIVNGNLSTVAESDLSVGINTQLDYFVSERDETTGEVTTKKADFIYLEKTNRGEAEEGLELDDSEEGKTARRLTEGEWYNSRKVFELPVRDIVGENRKARRIFISKDAANPNKAYTPYVIQIISPAWYGYEPEPIFEGESFKMVTDPGQARRAKKADATGNQFLHVCCEFGIKVLNNNDVHTHIGQ